MSNIRSLRLCNSSGIYKYILHMFGRFISNLFSWLLPSSIIRAYLILAFDNSGSGFSRLFHGRKRTP